MACILSRQTLISFYFKSARNLSASFHFSGKRNLILPPILSWRDIELFAVIKSSHKLQSNTHEIAAILHVQHKVALSEEIISLILLANSLFLCNERCAEHAIEKVDLKHLVQRNFIYARL